MCPVYLVVAVILPVLTLVYASFQRLATAFPRAGNFTLENYTTALSLDAVRSALWNSLILGLGTATIGVLLMGLLSWIIYRSRLPGAGAIEYILMFPQAVPRLVFAFGKAIAGPERSRVVAAILNVLGWLTLLILPLALLVYLQVASLPLHAAAVTAVQRHRACRPGNGAARRRVPDAGGDIFLGALLRLVLKNPGSVAFGLATVAGAAFLTVAAIAAATVPGTAATAARRCSACSATWRLPTRASCPTKALMGARTINLRGRDLRFARLDRAELPQTDLTGARLDGASLTGADLRGARLGCANASALPRVGRPRKGGLHVGQGRVRRRAEQMTGAKLTGADLRGANFDEAVLAKANDRALMIGATFERAKLGDRADLSGDVPDAASLLRAGLQGAVLTGARLEMADLTDATLRREPGGCPPRGCDAAWVKPGGRRPAARQALRRDMRGARLQAADLAGAAVRRASRRRRGGAC